LEELLAVTESTSGEAVKAHNAAIKFVMDLLTKVKGSAAGASIGALLRTPVDAISSIEAGKRAQVVALIEKLAGMPEADVHANALAKMHTRFSEVKEEAEEDFSF
jgi:hypothetical protein